MSRPGGGDTPDRRSADRAEDAEAPGGPEPRPGWIGRPGWRLAELFAATGFAIAQPLLSVFGRSPDTFIFRDASRLDVVAFAVLVTVVPTIAVWTVEQLVGIRSARAAAVLHLAALGALMGMQIAKKAVSWHGVAAVAAGLALGTAVVVAYRALPPARTWLRFAAVAPVVFVVMFLAASPVSTLVFPKAVHAARLGDTRNAPSVVMVVFDEWPTASFVGADGRVDADLFPNLARLAGTSTWYRNATAVTNSTWHAVPSLLTGKYPKDGQIPEAAAHPENLFTFLGGSYRLSVSEVVTRLCPPSLCTTPASTTTTGLGGLARDAAKAYRDMVRPSDRRTDVTAGFEERDTATAVEQARRATGPHDHATLDLGAATAQRPERFVQFLDSFKRDEKPTVHFLHILIPHVAYRYLPSGMQYDSPPGDFGKAEDGRWTAQARPPALTHQRMLLQAAYVDRLVGELLDRLEATGRLDRAVLVVTADHGIAFTPGRNARGLGDETVPPSLYPQVLWAPLFVKASGQRAGSVSDANVMSIDVLPTVARLVGFDLPWRVDGVPAGERRDPRKTFVWAHHNPFGVGIEPSVTFDGRSGLEAMLAGDVDAVTVPATRRSSSSGPSRTAASSVAPSRRSSGAPPPDRRPRSRPSTVDRSSGTVPALAWGAVDHDATVVLAVGGTVAGVSPTFRDGDERHRFAMMIPDELLHDGANDVAVFELRGSPGREVLHRLGVTSDGDG